MKTKKIRISGTGRIKGGTLSIRNRIKALLGMDLSGIGYAIDIDRTSFLEQLKGLGYEVKKSPIDRT